MKDIFAENWSVCFKNHKHEEFSQLGHVWCFPVKMFEMFYLLETVQMFSEPHHAHFSSCFQMFMAFTRMVLHAKKESRDRAERERFREKDTVNISTQKDRGHRKRAKKCCWGKALLQRHGVLQHGWRFTVQPEGKVCSTDRSGGSRPLFHALCMAVPRLEKLNVPSYALRCFRQIWSIYTYFIN